MTSDDVLAFWFQGDPNRFRREWFGKDEAYDNQIRETFGFTVQAAVDGALDSWAVTPHGALALVIVLDQFSRNIHRGSHRAFAGDAHARRIARGAVAGGVDMHLAPVQRCFLYLPFEHSENLADQDRSVQLFLSLPPHDNLTEAIASAHAHRDIIRRFGRFPHRNAALLRADTPAEREFLAEPASSF